MGKGPFGCTSAAHNTRKLRTFQHSFSARLALGNIPVGRALTQAIEEAEVVRSAQACFHSMHQCFPVSQRPTLPRFGGRK